MTGRKPLGSLIKTLTPAEVDVLRLLTKGLDIAEVATKLKKGEGTVRNQVKAILRKLDVPSQTKAVALVLGYRVKQLDKAIVVMGALHPGAADQVPEALL